MFKQLLCFVMSVILICAASSSILAQSGAPSQRPEGRPFITPPDRRPRPGRPVEDFLRSLFPPGESDPNFAPDIQQQMRPLQPQRPRVPTSQEVARLSAYEQRALLRKAVQSLDEDLDKIKTGAGWKNHLETEKLGSSLWCGNTLAPGGSKRADLTKIAERFDAIAENPKYKAIPELWGFQAVRAALGEYAMSPVDKSKRELRSTSDSLIRSIEGMSNADSWKGFLQTDDIRKLARAETDPTEDEEILLGKIVGQFHKVAENPDYRSVATMKGFKETSSILEKLSHDVMQQKASTSEEKASSEETVAALKAAPARPDSLQEQQSRMFDEVVAHLKSENLREADTTWKELVVSLQVTKQPIDPKALIQTALQEAYGDTLSDMQYAAEKVQFYNESKKELGDHIGQLRDISGQLDAESRVKIDVIEKLPEYSPGRQHFTIWKQQTITRDELEELIEELEEDKVKIEEEDRLTNEDFERSQQKQQQVIDTMSKVMKTMHDTASSVVRKVL